MNTPSVGLFLSLNKDQALDALVHLGYMKLHALVTSASKELYGHVPAGIEEMQVPELVSWFLIHFEYDEQAAKWSFYRDETKLEERADEAAYYGMFG